MQAVGSHFRKRKKKEEEYNKGMTRRTSDDEHLLELESQNKTK